MVSIGCSCNTFFFFFNLFHLLQSIIFSILFSHLFLNMLLFINLTLLASSLIHCHLLSLHFFFLMYNSFHYFIKFNSENLKFKPFLVWWRKREFLASEIKITYISLNNAAWYLPFFRWLKLYGDIMNVAYDSGGIVGMCKTNVIK